MTEPINLADVRSRVDIVPARRKEIAARMTVIKETQHALSEEYNALWQEDKELAQAEQAILRLMKRKQP